MKLGVKLTRLPMLFLTQMHAPHSHWARTQPQLKYSPRFLMKVPVFMAKNPDSFFLTPFLHHDQHYGVFTTGLGEPTFLSAPAFSGELGLEPCSPLSGSLGQVT